MNATSLLRCVACGAAAAPEDPRPWRCPNAADGGDHVLRVDLRVTEGGWPGCGDAHPFLAFGPLLHARRQVVARGLDPETYERAAIALDEAVAHTVGHGLVRAPWLEAPSLRGDLGVARVRALDCTGQPGGTHKIRHLFGVALWLDLMGVERDVPLATLSCGNAALAAAILARARGRPLEVFVPTTAREPLLRKLRELGARIVTCDRSPGCPGDPCLAPFRAAVERGAVPFSVQGSENGLCVEGGRTLAWELVAGLETPGQTPSALFVQVGGGALASALAQGLEIAHLLGALERVPRIHAVQTRAVHPLERAWRRLAAELVRAGGGDPTGLDARELARAAQRADAGARQRALAHAAAHRADYMRPWEFDATSVADAMLDDETYDWLEVSRAMLQTGGWPVLADELTLVEARELAATATGVDVSHTGAAGLAGALVAARAGQLEPEGDLALVLTG